MKAWFDRYGHPAGAAVPRDDKPLFDALARLEAACTQKGVELPGEVVPLDADALGSGSFPDKKSRIRS